MEIECVKEKLESVITKATRVTSKNLSLPILQYVYLEAKNNTLTIRATNLDVGVEYYLPVKTKKEGRVVFLGSVLSSFLSHVTDEKITINTTKNVLVIKTQKTQTQIKTINSEDFPSIPQINKPTSFQVKSNLISDGIRFVSYSAATSSMKPELSSVYITPNDNKLVFAATDSFRLAEKKTSIPNLPEFNHVLIPVKNTGEIVRVLDENSGDVLVKLDGNQIAFSGDGFYVTSRTIEGGFPDYQQIIPKNFSTTATVLKKDFLNTLRIANVFTDNFNKVLFRIKPKKNIFEIETKNTDVGENTQSLDGALSGDDITITFNHKYIIDCFQSIKTDSVNIQLSGEGKPMVITGVSDNSFTYLVMPMNK